MNRAPIPARRVPLRPARRHGFSLVEVLVGMALGLISMVVIFSVFESYEGRQRTTISQVDATESGMMALLAIERDARQGGLGLIGFGRGSDRQIVCRSINFFDGTALATQVVMPVRVVEGTGAAGDAIEVTYGSSPFSATPARLVADVATSDPANDLVVTNAANGLMFANGDTILVSEPATPTKPCAQLRVTGQAPDLAGLRIQHAAGAYPGGTTNPDAGDNIFPVTPTVGYRTSATAPALVINVGRLTRVRYAVSGRSLQASDLATGAQEALADSIVAVQAQYGVTAVATSQDISAWVNPTGTWAAPTPEDVARIKAVRIAVVARSTNPEREDVTAATCTTPGGTVNAGPCAWIDDTTASPAPAIDLSSLGGDWRRYRYRVYETVVPLRNVIWGDVRT